MNRAQRRKVAKVLLKFRRKMGWTRDKAAAELGWDINTYAHAELAMISISEGQQNDVRRVMKAGIRSATIRDKLRAAGRKRIITRRGL